MKVRVETAYGEWVERIPAWIKWATQVNTAHLSSPCLQLLGAPCSSKQLLRPSMLRLLSMPEPCCMGSTKDLKDAGAAACMHAKLSEAPQECR